MRQYVINTSKIGAFQLYHKTDIKYFQIVKNLPEVWLNLIIKNNPIMTKKLTFIDMVHFFDFQVVFEQINFTKK